MAGITAQDDDKYWYNTATGTVEHGMLAPARDRVGPFDTAEEAAHAPELLQERARRWAQEDRDEDDWGAPGR